MYTIGAMAKQVGISRSSLLYYDRIGLFSPSLRSPSNYRLYTRGDLERLEKIMVYREAGLSLQQIKRILARALTGFDADAILDKRLEQINGEISLLRQQQQIIAALLGQKPLSKRMRIVTRKSWNHLLRASGLDDRGMHKWHMEFEKVAPQAHQDFLESLGFSMDKIEKIRNWSRQKTPDSPGKSTLED